MMNKDFLRIKYAIEFIEDNYSAQPGLEELSQAIHVSPYHLQRLFKRWAGVTPKQFLQCVTLKHTNKSLRNGDNLLNATMDAGLSSSSRLHDLYINFHAMSPAQYRNKGQGLTINFGYHDSPFGNMIIGMTEKGICNLFFSQSNSSPSAKEELNNYWPNARFIYDNAGTAQIADYIFSDQDQPARALNLHLGGTNFQVKVWQALLQIPFAEVSNYGQIAKSINSAGAYRAVGSAVGKNPVAVLIPCHRVIKSTGAIGDYHWGKTRKQTILTWEQCRLRA